MQSGIPRVPLNLFNQKSRLIFYANVLVENIDYNFKGFSESFRVRSFGGAWVIDLLNNCYTAYLRQ